MFIFCSLSQDANWLAKAAGCKRPPSRHEPRELLLKAPAATVSTQPLGQMRKAAMQLYPRLPLHSNQATSAASAISWQRRKMVLDHAAVVPKSSALVVVRLLRCRKTRPASKSAPVPGPDHHPDCLEGVGYLKLFPTSAEDAARQPTAADIGPCPHHRNGGNNKNDASSQNNVVAGPVP